MLVAKHLLVAGSALSLVLLLAIFCLINVSKICHPKKKKNCYELFSYLIIPNSLVNNISRYLNHNCSIFMSYYFLEQK